MEIIKKRKGIIKRQITRFTIETGVIIQVEITKMETSIKIIRKR
jgi:hypothetical protein